MQKLTELYFGADLQSNPVESVTIEPDEGNLLHWTGVIVGPRLSAYQGGRFRIEATFPLEYPFKAPVVKFLTRCYHPNITSDGSMCVGLLKAEAWKPSTKIEHVLRAIVNLLVEPNPDDALVADIAELYVRDRKSFEKNAQEYVKKYAQ